MNWRRSQEEEKKLCDWKSPSSTIKRKKKFKMNQTIGQRLRIEGQYPRNPHPLPTLPRPFRSSPCFSQLLLPGALFPLLCAQARLFNSNIQSKDIVVNIFPGTAVESMATDAEKSNLRYAGKVTIVTGGSKGIGEGVVREFGKNVTSKTFY